MAAAAFAAALGSTAMAQTGPVGRFDNGYLDQHPEVARQLKANPRLIDSPEYVEQHPGLANYLKEHPAVREDIQEHPDRFMRNARVRDEWENAHPMRNTDAYLDRHPKLAQQLNAHPGLVDNPKFMAAHPGLREFFERHPVARTEWKARPHRYMANERKYETAH
jgi:hypothetical protein